MELGITEKTYIGNKISSQLNLCEEAISNLKITKSQISNIEKVLESFTKSLRLDPHQNEIWDIIHFPFYIIKYIKKNENNLLLNYFKNKELNSINFSLLNYQLNLGEEYSKDFFNKAIKTIKENTKSTITNPNYISEGAKQEVNLPKNMIALMHFGRSGTGFLHSLIDNHSEVSTLPSYYFNHFFNTSTWEDITKDGWDKMIDRFISSYEVFFDARVEKPVPTCSSFALVSDQGKKKV